MANFDLRSFLTENKLTNTSKRLNEGPGDAIGNWEDDIVKARREAYNKFEQELYKELKRNFHYTSGGGGVNYFEFIPKDVSKDKLKELERGTPIEDIEGIRYVVGGDDPRGNEDFVSIGIFSNEEGTGFGGRKQLWGKDFGLREFDNAIKETVRAIKKHF